jgi:hypothetical protein
MDDRMARDQQVQQLCYQRDSTPRARSPEIGDRLQSIEEALLEVTALIAAREGRLEQMADQWIGRDRQIQQLTEELTAREVEIQHLTAEVRRLQKPLVPRPGLIRQLAHGVAAPFRVCGELAARTTTRIRTQASRSKQAVTSTFRLRSRGLSAVAGFKLTRMWRRGRLARQVLRQPFFDAAWYLQQYTDVAAAGTDPLTHFLQRGVPEGRLPSPLFDTTWYLLQNPDIAAARIHPLLHFLLYGAVEGRQPNPLFDWECLLRQRAGQRDSGPHPLAHLVAPGTEVRRDPNPYFDAAWYLARYPDVAAAKINPVAHYVDRGWTEGRNPGPLFDNDWYLRQYPDVPGINPLAHYLCYGMAEGRAPNPTVRETFAGPTPAGPIAFASHDQPLISIVVPTHRQWLHTMWLLYSIHANSAGVAYEVIVADGSPDNSSAALRHLVQDVRTIHGSPSEQMAGFARGQYVLLLRDDVLVQPGCLARLVALAQQPEQPSVYGPGHGVYHAREDDGIVRQCCPYGPGEPEIDYTAALAVLVRQTVGQELPSLSRRIIAA